VLWFAAVVCWCEAFFVTERLVDALAEVDTELALLTHNLRYQRVTRVIDANLRSEQAGGALASEGKVGGLHAQHQRSVR